ncbi:hypothetical protein DRW07_03075 [Alteromonas sediminis]|uniref:WD40 repeat domain-containing protein n=1 Tax=Alteromonas sediminis TaxID=2259342 RepID=A0A3N5Y5K8_9ALTE|nr:hypothetical protein [Alteromonas sediminis]RPJ68406.1 hypothetical protein DRW07_03075 [Alteromonas sediminis]
MKRFFVCLVYWVSIQTMAQQTQNIWLIDVSKAQGDAILASVKVSDNASYSNQPHFVDGKNILLYTQSFTQGEADQTDAMAYDIEAGNTVNLTQSATSEYSPTPYKDGFSTILVDSAGKQWLWAFDEKGESIGKLSHAEPVGYHVWLNDTEALAFILGQPHTLQRLNLGGSDTVIDENIGASLWAVPQSDKFSYSKQDQGQTLLMAFSPETGDKTQLTVMPAETVYYAWLPDGSAVAGKGSSVLRWSPNSAQKEWQIWLDLSEQCGEISRLHTRDLDDRIQVAVVCTDI